MPPKRATRSTNTAPHVQMAYGKIPIKRKRGESPDDDDQFHSASESQFPTSDLARSEGQASGIGSSPETTRPTLPSGKMPSGLTTSPAGPSSAALVGRGASIRRVSCTPTNGVGGTPQKTPTPFSLQYQSTPKGGRVLPRIKKKVKKGRKKDVLLLVYPSSSGEQEDGQESEKERESTADVRETSGVKPGNRGKAIENSPRKHGRPGENIVLEGSQAPPKKRTKFIERTSMAPLSRKKKAMPDIPRNSDMEDDSLVGKKKVKLDVPGNSDVEDDHVTGEYSESEDMNVLLSKAVVTEREKSYASSALSQKLSLLESKQPKKKGKEVARENSKTPTVAVTGSVREQSPDQVDMGPSETESSEYRQDSPAPTPPPRCDDDAGGEELLGDESIFPEEAVRAAIPESEDDDDSDRLGHFIRESKHHIENTRKQLIALKKAIENINQNHAKASPDSQLLDRLLGALQKPFDDDTSMSCRQRHKYMEDNLAEFQEMLDSMEELSVELKAVHKKTMIISSKTDKALRALSKQSKNKDSDFEEEKAAIRAERAARKQMITEHEKMRGIRDGHSEPIETEPHTNGHRHVKEGNDDDDDRGSTEGQEVEEEGPMIIGDDGDIEVVEIEGFGERGARAKAKANQTNHPNQSDHDDGDEVEVLEDRGWQKDENLALFKAIARINGHDRFEQIKAEQGGVDGPLRNRSVDAIKQRVQELKRELADGGLLGKLGPWWDDIEAA